MNSLPVPIGLKDVHAVLFGLGMGGALAKYLGPDTVVMFALGSMGLVVVVLMLVMLAMVVRLEWGGPA